VRVRFFSGRPAGEKGFVRGDVHVVRGCRGDFVTLVRCPKCGKEHDLWESEVGFELPDEVFALPHPARQERATSTTDLCVLDETRFFIRVVLLIPVRGEGRDFGWGVWAEVSPADYARYKQLWDSTEQRQEPAFLGHLANALPGCGAALGLRLRVHLESPAERPSVTIAEDQHPLAQDQRDGVHPERVLEWLSEYLH
jgi:hypothetical protein